MEVKPTYDPADLARWAGGTWRALPESPVTGCTIDTRSVEEGDLFVAIAGTRTDGHAFIHDALANGAAAVLVDDKAALNGMQVPALIVDSTRKALMDIAREYRATLSCRLVAVTGSVGKTTVKELAADALQHVGITARTRGNWNNDLGMPLSLLAARPDSDFGVFEVGMNSPGELDPLCAVLAPDVAVVTCVGPVHIEQFPDLKAIAHEKAAAFRSLKRDGIAVINADDEFADYLIEQADGRRVVTVSRHPGADYVYDRLDRNNGHFTLTERDTGEVVDIHTALPGEYFVVDAALSAAVARVLGVGWNPIIDAVRNYRPLSMRWNRKKQFGVHTVNDAYNANPVSVRAAVDAFLEEPVEGTRWLVLAGMLELGADEQAIHGKLGEMIASRPGLKLITVGERGRWIADGAVRSGMDGADVTACGDTESAAKILFEKLVKGDAVLFKASRGEAVEEALDQWVRLKEEAAED